jgi:hypothetical protein
MTPPMQNPPMAGMNCHPARKSRRLTDSSFKHGYYSSQMPERWDQPRLPAMPTEPPLIAQQSAHAAGPYGQ